MRVGRVLQLLICGAFLPPIFGAETWIRLTTPHFEMYTANGEKQATAMLQTFEQVRSFFLERSASKSAPQTTIRIVAFRSEKEYRPYRLNEGAVAYYTRSRKVDYIVMQDLGSNHDRTAMHEYTHLIVEHLKLKLPIWLNEGMADLYSSLEANGNQVTVGKPLPESVAYLRSEGWLDLNTLLTVDHESPYYNKKDKMQIFYAESWALTHMLALGPNYQSNFPRFFATVASGRSPEDSFQSIYGKSIAQVEKDLHNYIQQTQVRISVFDTKLAKPELEPDVSTVSDLNLKLVLADLLACSPKTMPQAKEQLSELAKDHPESGDVQESLGYLEWVEGNHDRARECFKQALSKGSKNPEMMLHYAQLLYEANASDPEIAAVLQQAVAIKPGFDEAEYNLGAVEMKAGKWGAALSAFSTIKTVQSDRAFALFTNMALCNWRLKAIDNARDFAQKAKKYARNPDDAERATKLLDALNSPSAAQAFDRSEISAAAAEGETSGPEKPALRRRALPRDTPSVRWPGNVQHVEAVAKSFDCDQQTPRLRVTVGTKELVLAIDGPENVVVRNSRNNTFDFACGPQEAIKLSIFYMPAEPGSGVDGVVRELVF